jgi:hypothetical protein
MPALLTRIWKGSAVAMASHSFDVRHIEDQSAGLLAAGADRRGRLLDFAFRARRERHLRAGRGKRGGRRKPDAAATAGDQRALAVKPQGWSFGEIDRSHALAHCLIR